MTKPKVLHIMSWSPKPDNPLLGNFCIRHLEAAAIFSDSVWLKVEESDQNGCYNISVEEKPEYHTVTVNIPHVNNRLVNRLLHFKAYQKGYSYVCQHFFKPDLLHLHVARNLGVMALFWKKICHMPYVWSEHATYYLQPEVKKLGYLWGRVANGASCVMPVSRLLADTLQKLGVKSPMEIVYNVLDKDYLAAFPKTNATPPWRLLHISTLNRCKNFMGILHVMERLKQENLGPFVLEVVHDFPAETYQKWVDNHNLQEQVRFLGPKNEDELLQLYAQSHALVMFSNLETFSCTVMEAVGVGIPVIATRTGALPDMLADGRGVVVEPDDEEALFNSIVQFMNNGHPLNVSQQKAYARAAFSMETVGRRILEVYQKVTCYS